VAVGRECFKRILNMDRCEADSVKDQKEGDLVDFSSANRVKNKTLRRAQVLKDRCRKNKVCNHKMCVCLHVY
jgi:hypothetical protein